jgi:hypothetical protein
VPLLIAIVGNVRSQAGDAQVLAAEQASKELGRQLAVAGHEIVVYSSNPVFAERHVVTGYVASQQAKPNSVHVKYTQGVEIDFPERQTHSVLFALHHDSTSDWEVSFYDSLSEVDGILLIGGGRSTLIAGMVGLGYDIAVIPVPIHGGFSYKVWALLKSRNIFLKPQEVDLLANPAWTPDHAATVIGLFQAHVDRANEKQAALQREALRLSAEMKRSAVLAVVLFLVVAAMLLVSVTSEDLPRFVFAAIIGVGSVLSGISGATIRTLADLNEDRALVSKRPTYIRTCLGIIAGLFAALLVAVPQLTNEAHLPEHALKVLTDGEMLHMRSARVQNVVPLSLFSAFVTAFLLDQFYRRLGEFKVKEIVLPGKE